MSLPYCPTYFSVTKLQSQLKNTGCDPTKLGFFSFIFLLLLLLLTSIYIYIYISNGYRAHSQLHKLSFKTFESLRLLKENDLEDERESFEAAWAAKLQSLLTLGWLARRIKDQYNFLCFLQWLCMAIFQL